MSPLLSDRTVVGQHLETAARTSRLQCSARIGPEINASRADRSAVQPSIGVYDVHHAGVRGGNVVGAWVECREGRIKCGDSAIDKNNVEHVIHRPTLNPEQPYLGSWYFPSLRDCTLRPTIPASWPPSECPTK